MNRRSGSLLVLCLGAALDLAALPAVAGDHEKQWNRGCTDSKANSYDRARHNADYEAGAASVRRRTRLQ
jgi:hypothetical protein